MCHGQKSLLYIGDGHPTFNRNPYNGYINPYSTIGLMTIPYYMEIMGVKLDPGTYDLLIIYLFGAARNSATSLAPLTTA